MATILLCSYELQCFLRPSSKTTWTKLLKVISTLQFTYLLIVFCQSIKFFPIHITFFFNIGTVKNNFITITSAITYVVSGHFRIYLLPSTTYKIKL